MKPRRKILMPVVFVLFLGWLVAWGTDKALEPKPLFEISLKPGQTAYLNLGFLMVPSSDGSMTFYQLNDGSSVTLHDNKFYTVEDVAQPPITQPAKKIAVTDVESSYYLDATPEREKQQQQERYIFFDPVKRLSFRFHGYREDDRFKRVMGYWYNRKCRYCLIRHYLPISIIAWGGFAPVDSPASLLFNQTVNFNPIVWPSLCTVVSVPEKQIVSSFLLDGSWMTGATSLSPSGRYVACYQTHQQYQPRTGDQLHRFWDVAENKWLIPLPEADIMTSSFNASRTFIGDTVIVGNTKPIGPSSPVDCFSVLDIKSGQLLDHLQGVSTFFFATKQARTEKDGSLWYLSRIGIRDAGMSYALKRLKGTSAPEIITNHKWDHADVGVALTAGLQSIVPGNGHNQLSQFLQARLGKTGFYRLIEPWIVRPDTSVYDWKTGRSYSCWSGDHKWFTTPTGDYLLIRHHQTDNQGKKYEKLAQVYQLPMKLWSPWWSRCIGITLTVLLLTLFWQWRSRQLLKVKN